MSAFAVVQCPEGLERLCQDLTAFSACQPGGGLDDRVLLGIWIEYATARAGVPLEVPDWWPASGGVALASSLELGGAWALCRTVSPRVTRDSLLSVFTAAVARDPRNREGRFLPVFPSEAAREACEAECRRLASKYRGHVLAPVYQRSNGDVCLDDLEWAERLMAPGALPA
jgi:hypothetical protein